jgi:hypothetical protein
MNAMTRPAGELRENNTHFPKVAPSKSYSLDSLTRLSIVNSDYSGPSPPRA